VFSRFSRLICDNIFEAILSPSTSISQCFLRVNICMNFYLNQTLKRDTDNCLSVWRSTCRLECSSRLRIWFRCHTLHLITMSDDIRFVFAKCFVRLREKKFQASRRFLIGNRASDRAAPEERNWLNCRCYWLTAENHPGKWALEIIIIKNYVN
jgi:hypothetical protein